MAHATITPTTGIGDLVTSRLRHLRTKIKAWFLVDGTSRLLTAVVIFIGIDLLIDWFFQMDRAQRGVMLVLAVVALATVFYRRLIRPLSQRMSDDALCLQVEDQYDELGESLISAVQFSRMRDFESRGVSPSLVKATIDHGMRAAERVAFGKILRADQFVKNLVLLVVMLLTLTGVGVAAVVTDPMAIWWNRNIMLGDREWPQDTYLIVEGVQDGRLIIPRGDDWPLVVTVSEESRRQPDEVYVEIKSESSYRTEPMDKQADGRTFQTTLKNVVEEFEFRVRSYRTRTAWFEATLVDRPVVEQLTLTVTPPSYAGAKTEDLASDKGPYYLLKGSRLEIRGTANKPLSAASFTLAGKRHDIKIINGSHFSGTLEPDVLAAVFEADEPAAAICEIELIDTERLLLPGRSQPGPLSSKRPTRFTLKLQTDREPQVKVRLWGIGGMVVPKARLPFGRKRKAGDPSRAIPCTATDDFQVTSLRLVYRWRNDESTIPENSGVISLNELEDVKARLNGPKVNFEGYVLDLAPLEIPVGSGLSLQIEADDNDLVSGPKTGKSIIIALRVVSEDELRTDLLRREKEQRQEFERLLKQQEDMQTECEAMLADTRDQAKLPAEKRQLLVKIQKRQKLLGTNLEGIAARLTAVLKEVLNNRLEEEDGPLQKRLQSSVINPMWSLTEDSIPLAALHVGRARQFSAEPDQRNEALAEATVLQREIAETMREILQYMVKAEGFQEAVNLLYEIQRAQQDVFKLTDKEKQDRIRKILEEGGAVKKPEIDGNQNKNDESKE